MTVGYRKTPPLATPSIIHATEDPVTYAKMARLDSGKELATRFTRSRETDKSIPHIARLMRDKGT